MGGMGASGRLGDVPEAPGIHNETAAFKTKGGPSTRCLQGRLESGPLLAVVRISLQSTCAARGSRSRTSVARITRSTTHARTSSARLPKATWPEQRSRACATARSSTFGRAQTIADLHRAHGVRIISDDTVARFEGTRRVASVVTRRGLRLECDFVVVGIGIEPVVDMLGDSGIHLDNGVVVDQYCRTNISGIYAAGDVANHYHPVFDRQMRVEHWQNAVKQGAAAARSMLGKLVTYDEVHWFWSDQYEANLQYAG
jgi:hypothetical protein